MSFHLFEIINYFDEPVLTLGLISFLLILVALPISFWAVGSNKSSSFVRVCIALANLVLASQLALRWFESGHFPISNLYESLCFLTWAFTFSQLWVERLWPSPLVAAVSTPMSLLLIAFASPSLPHYL